MASRKFKNSLIQAAIEVTPGTAETLTAADAVLISDVTFSNEYQNVERNLIRRSMGHGGTLVGSRHVTLQFTCELSGSGTAGTAPVWGKLLQACLFAESVVAAPGARVEYTPVSENYKTLTIAYSIDGVRHLATGCVGTVKFNLPASDRPTLQFNFVGDDAGVAALAVPNGDFTEWHMPEVVNAQNSGKLTLGATLAAGAITGGTEYCSRGLELDMANATQYLDLLGCGTPDVTDRKPAGSYSIEVTAAQEVTMRADINANTPTTISLLHGSGTGKQILVHVAQAVRLNPKYDDFNGALLFTNDFNAEPIDGNDELTIVAL